MAHLFSHLLASRAGLAASAVFYHIKNNKTRLEMLDIAARISLGFKDRRDLLAEWQALSKSVANASRLRNQIAHSEVEDKLTETGFEYKLQQPSFDYSRLDPSNPDKFENYRLRRLSYRNISTVWPSIFALYPMRLTNLHLLFAVNNSE
jgi:hypothetical protein